MVYKEMHIFYKRLFLLGIKMHQTKNNRLQGLGFRGIITLNNKNINHLEGV